MAITDGGEPVVIPAQPFLPPDTSVQVAIAIAHFAFQFPWLSMVIGFLGSNRIWGKPASLLIHWAVRKTKGTWDDRFLEVVERSPAWAWFWWLIDYVFSIKRDAPGTVVKVTKAVGDAASAVSALLLAGGLAISAMSMGCVGLAPGAEAFVVRSEQTIASSFATVDTFVHWEEANRDSLPESVSAVADTLREDFPPAHAAALASILTYKRTRSAEDKDRVNAWLATLRTMADQATKARAEISKS
ncbi:MAG: hypothetical protein U1G08_02440 [Verrucomicrobiota bacterium]